MGALKLFELAEELVLICSDMHPPGAIELLAWL